MLIDKMYPSRTSGYGNKAVAEALEAKAGFECFCHTDAGGIFFRSFTAFMMTKNWNLKSTKPSRILDFIRALATNKRGADSGECFF
jgi:hypothetical protein